VNLVHFLLRQVDGKFKTCHGLYRVETSGYTEIVDITDRVQQKLFATGLTEGIANMFSVGSTGGLTTVEYEPGLVRELQKLFEGIAPSRKRYFHDAAWHDGNGYAHLRSSLLKTDLSVPFSGRKFLLGTWQQIVFVDFDNRSRKRKIIVQFMGE